MGASDIFTSQPSYGNNLCVARARDTCYGKAVHIVSFRKEKRLGSAWKDDNGLQKKLNFKGWSLLKQQGLLINAVATVEPKCLAPTENDNISNSNLHFSSNSESQVLQSSNDESPETDDREKFRRIKISKANKGNVPWNKGRKHSEETLQRIRERTRIAMQDPKVRMKLMNLGHAQSEETRIKIGVGVREGWQRRRERLMVQEGCVLEWQNMVAEAARMGCAGEDELQWDSYVILNEQLKQEWLASIEKRKTMRRPKGSKRAPKSPEQRRKISEAISTKWADPVYRDRVCAALAKYHGTPVGAERRRQRKPNDGTLVKETLEKGESMKKTPVQPKFITNVGVSTKKVTSKRKKNTNPSYKDPLASMKLEMIKKIRAQRAAMGTKKRDAIERAKLLIAEAEKAAKALEIAAPKSPLVQASLLESRKLIAEATRSIESIKSGQLTTQDVGDNMSLVSARPVNHRRTAPGMLSSNKLLDERLVNGNHLFPSSVSNYGDLDSHQFILRTAVNGREASKEEQGSEDLTGVNHDHLSSSWQPNKLREESEARGSIAGRSVVNGSIRYQNSKSKGDKEGTLGLKSESSIASPTKTKKKWVCGRLVEVEEDQVG